MNYIRMPNRTDYWYDFFLTDTYTKNEDIDSATFIQWYGWLDWCGRLTDKVNMADKIDEPDMP